MFPWTLDIHLAFLTLLFTSIIAAVLKTSSRKHGWKQPPSPPGLPVLGHLHLLGELPHRSLQTLATTYGPIMSLSLGHVPTIVLSTANAAELFIKSNDVVFANRPLLQAFEYFSYGFKGLVFSEYGPYWRGMRRLCKLNLLSASKVESFAPLRMKEVEKMVKEVDRAVMANQIVNLSEVVNDVLESMVYKTILGCDIKKNHGLDLKGIVQEVMRLSGAFNLADYVPWLGVFDFQGMRRRFKRIGKALDEVLEEILKEHEEASSSKANHNDFIDILLSLMHEDDDIDRTNIKAIVVDMIGAALETSATIIVWALSELLRNPMVMKALQHELDTVIGPDNLVEEKDIGKLDYLEMVVKETFRLHPAGSLLPRETVEDVEVGGYYVAKKTRIMVNMWALGRDPKAWPEKTEEFWPERFLETEVDFRGRDSLIFMPFGTGRRGCPGIQLGLCTVKLVVAQLIHCFRWELPSGMTPEDLDMKEKFGLSMPKAEHLLAVPSCRVRTKS
ncbi:cytochrome P450 CYP736A12-like [Prosopis cineraria]|uniref:cytochrome P450 CYP736A12-like n=1 Tax=Prosopis cineraria TaxID=364024 RepID=UPI00240EFF8C|nr:cytochrome P450 CYP736A12-like [Prosopis cineraria]